MHFTQLYSMETKFTLPSGLERVAHVYVSYAHEEESPKSDFDFGDAKANARYLKRFESGALQLVCIQVVATCNGFTGCDFLGMSHVRTAQFERDVKRAVKDHGMIQKAIDRLLYDIKSTGERLDLIAGGSK